MNLALFTEWLDTFNRWCMNQGRCIVLLMDNASAHMISSGTEGEMSVSYESRVFAGEHHIDCSAL